MNKPKLKFNSTVLGMVVSYGIMSLASYSHLASANPHEQQAQASASVLAPYKFSLRNAGVANYSYYNYLLTVLHETSNRSVDNLSTSKPILPLVTAIKQHQLKLRDQLGEALNKRNQELQSADNSEAQANESNKNKVSQTNTEQEGKSNSEVVTGNVLFAENNNSSLDNVDKESDTTPGVVSKSDESVNEVKTDTDSDSPAQEPTSKDTENNDPAATDSSNSNQESELTGDTVQEKTAKESVKEDKDSTTKETPAKTKEQLVAELAEQKAKALAKPILRPTSKALEGSQLLDFGDVVATRTKNQSHLQVTNNLVVPKPEFGKSALTTLRELNKQSPTNLSEENNSQSTDDLGSYPEYSDPQTPDNQVTPHGQYDLSLPSLSGKNEESAVGMPNDTSASSQEQSSKSDSNVGTNVLGSEDEQSPISSSESNQTSTNQSTANNDASSSQKTVELVFNEDLYKKCLQKDGVPAGFAFSKFNLTLPTPEEAKYLALSEDCKQKSYVSNEVDTTNYTVTYNQYNYPLYVNPPSPNQGSDRLPSNDKQLVWPNPTNPTRNVDVKVVGAFRNIEDISKAGWQGVHKTNNNVPLPQDTFFNILANELSSPELILDTYRAYQEAQVYKTQAALLSVVVNSLAYLNDQDNKDALYTGHSSDITSLRSVGVPVSGANLAGFWPNPYPSKNNIVDSDALATASGEVKDHNPYGQLIPGFKPKLTHIGTYVNEANTGSLLLPVPADNPQYTTVSSNDRFTKLLSSAPVRDDIDYYLVVAMDSRLAHYYDNSLAPSERQVVSYKELFRTLESPEASKLVEKYHLLTLAANKPLSVKSQEEVSRGGSTQQLPEEDLTLDTSGDNNTSFNPESSPQVQPEVKPEEQPETPPQPDVPTNDPDDTPVTEPQPE